MEGECAHAVQLQLTLHGELRGYQRILLAKAKLGFGLLPWHSY